MHAPRLALAGVHGMHALHGETMERTRAAIIHAIDDGLDFWGPQAQHQQQHMSEMGHSSVFLGLVVLLLLLLPHSVGSTDRASMDVFLLWWAARSPQTTTGSSNAARIMGRTQRSATAQASGSSSSSRLGIC